MTGVGALSSAVVETFTSFSERLMRRPVLHVMTYVVLFYLLFAGWALFLPLGSSPDESAHYVYSAAVVRGQAGSLTPVVPARIDSVHDLAGCLAFKIDVTAACQSAERAFTNQDVLSRTHVGLYNPVFYAYTGVGSLLVPTENGMYIGRLLAAAVSASLLGWAVSFLTRRTASRWVVTSLFVALTPMVVYMCSVQNPNGWEIAAALATTVAMWRIAVTPGRPGSSWTEAHSLMVVAACILVTARGLSPLLLASIIVAIVICAGWSRMREILRQPITYIAFAPILLVGALSVIWILVNGTNYVGVAPPESLEQGIASIPIYFGIIDGQLNQVVGQLGWLDLPAPHLVVFGWLSAAAAYVFVCFGSAASRARLAIVLAVATCLLLPGILSGIQWSGLGWQGRYTLPFIVATLLIAALSSEERMQSATDESLESRLARIAAVGAPAGFLLAHVWIMLQGVHRYLKGASADLFAEVTWRPPVSMWPLAACVAVGLLGATAMLATTALRRDSPVIDGSGLAPDGQRVHQE